MDKKYDGIARIAVAGGIAAIGLTLGGVAMANAADDSAGSTTTTTVAPDGGHRGGPGGPGGAGRAADLAEELGIDEQKVADALAAVRDELPRPDRPAAGEAPTPPTAAERAERQAAFATALADELDLTTAKVSDALAAIQAEHQAEHRTALSTRLDTAVTDGDLTAADKASVLKAFDAGVLGGGPGAPGGR